MKCIFDSFSSRQSLRVRFPCSTLWLTTTLTWWLTAPDRHGRGCTNISPSATAGASSRLCWGPRVAATWPSGAAVPSTNLSLFTTTTPTPKDRIFAWWWKVGHPRGLTLDLRSSTGQEGGREGRGGNGARGFSQGSVAPSAHFFFFILSSRLDESRCLGPRALSPAGRRVREGPGGGHNTRGRRTC